MTSPVSGNVEGIFVYLAMVSVRTKLEEDLRVPEDGI